MSGMRSRVPYRCRKCRREGKYWFFTVRVATHRRKNVKHKSCKSDDVVCMRAAMEKAEANRLHLRCDCDNVPHPHRKATHQLCRYYDHGVITTEKELELIAMQERILNWPGRTTCR